MTSKAETNRRERKAMLEATIEQQRVDVLLAAEHWQEAASPLEAGWQVVHRYRTPALAAGSLLLLLLARRPGKVLKIGHRILLGATTLKRLQKLLPGHQ